MHDPRLKEKAMALRKAGKSITSIAIQFRLNKTTISYWCRNIKLPESAIVKLEAERKSKSAIALLRYSEINRERRIKRTENQKSKGARLIGKLSEKETQMIGIGLYWGEGYKESNGEMGFTNSNPDIIRFYLRWLSQWGVTKSELIFRLSLNRIFTKHEKEIKNFWTKILNVNVSQFSKTTFIKTSLKKANVKNREKYKGTLRVKVRKGLSLKNEILGAIEYIAAGA